MKCAPWSDSGRPSKRSSGMHHDFPANSREIRTFFEQGPFGSDDRAAGPRKY
jgi:hypothetical protein